jgi:glyoxylase-like metal-dependent hydrolase (beta-lactamase superfamily II)
MRSIATLLDALPDDTGVLPGHMEPTTLERERQTNPFLRELATR